MHHQGQAPVVHFSLPDQEGGGTGGVVSISIGSTNRGAVSLTRLYAYTTAMNMIGHANRSPMPQRTTPAKAMSQSRMNSMKRSHLHGHLQVI